MCHLKHMFLSSPNLLSCSGRRCWTCCLWCYPRTSIQSDFYMLKMLWLELQFHLFFLQRRWSWSPCPDILKQKESQRKSWRWQCQVLMRDLWLEKYLAQKLSCFVNIATIFWSCTHADGKELGMIVIIWTRSLVWKSPVRIMAASVVVTDQGIVEGNNWLGKKHQE